LNSENREYVQANNIQDFKLWEIVLLNNDFQKIQLYNLNYKNPFYLTKKDKMTNEDGGRDKYYNRREGNDYEGKQEQGI